MSFLKWLFSGMGNDHKQHEEKSKDSQVTISNDEFSYNEEDIIRAKESLESATISRDQKIENLLTKLNRDLETGVDQSPLDHSSIDAACELGRMGEQVFDRILPYLSISSDAYMALGTMKCDKAKQILLFLMRKANDDGVYPIVRASAKALGYYVEDQEVLDNLGWINDFSKDAMASQIARISIDRNYTR